MRTCSFAQSGHIVPAPRTRGGRSTAYYLFDKKDPANLHQFMVDGTHFRARNNQFGRPIATDGSREDQDRIQTEMIHTAGVVGDILEHYLDGATIKFPTAATPAKIYKLIIKHLKAHLQAMKTEVDYAAPPRENFENWGMFAMALRPMAISHDKYLEGGRPADTFSYFLSRPTFSDQGPAPEAAKDTQLPQVQKLLNNISHWLEMMDEW